MERIFKIKTKSNVDPRCQYPSERRYSASIVIGLSVVFFQLSLYSILMGSLIIHKLTLHKQGTEVEENMDFPFSTTSEYINLNSTEEMIPILENSFNRLSERVEKDLDARASHYYINIPALVCGSCFLMALGYICSFVAGILAWHRWYIDHNITLFFLASTFSILTTAMCLLITGLITLNFNSNIYETHPATPITFSLAINIVILSSIGLIWSFLSSKVAYKGMKNGYPEEGVGSKSGQTIQVSTIRKGSKNCTPFPPDIINHFPVGEKLSKYIPKRDIGDLPKPESNYEYQQRVNQFLSGTSDHPEHIK